VKNASFPQRALLFCYYMAFVCTCQRDGELEEYLELELGIGLGWVHLR